MIELLLLLAVVAFAAKFGRRLSDLESKVKAQTTALDGLSRRLGGQPIAQPGDQPVKTSPEPITSQTKTTPAATIGVASGITPPAGTVPPIPAKPQPAAPSGPSLEERLGTRWAVWLGGAALALGGILMVHFSIESGFFGPGVRIAIAALFSIALLAAGEWLRRSDMRLDLGGVPSAHIPSIVSAAGTVAGFGTIYAAHALYGFIGPAAAFVLLGAAGVATMFAAALHGPALAGLGLAGSLITPMLISSPNPSAWPVVLYLGVVAAAAYWLARARRYLWLAACVVAGVVVWGLLLAGAPQVSQATWTTALFVHAIVQLALAAVFMALEPHSGTTDDSATIDWIGSAALAALTALAIVILASTRFAADGWLLFAMAAMTILAGTAYRVPAVAAAAVLAGLMALAVATLWPGLSGTPESRYLWPAVADYVRVPEIIQSYLTFATFSTIAIAGLATWRLWNGRALRPATAGFYALGAIVTPLAVLIMTYLRVTQFDTSYAFAGIAVTLAGLFYLIADRFDNVPADQKSPFTRHCIGAFSAGCSAAAALAFSFALSRGYLTVAFAVAAATTALFAVIDKIPALRYVVATLGLLVLARLAWDPRIMGANADVGTWPILNWLLIGYGAPAAAFLGAGFILKREKEDLASRLCDGLGILFAFLLVFFQIRHFMNGGDALAPTTGHVEQGLMATLSLGMAYVLTRVDLARMNIVFRTASLAFGVLAVVQAAFSLGLAENPFLSNDRIGGSAIFSTLLLTYLLPGAAAVLLARLARGIRPGWYVTMIAILALGLLFAYVTLETRHVFQGEQIGIMRRTGPAEIWAYSAVWLVLGMAFLAYGLLRGAIEPRIASAALIVLATAKVFLFDLAGITGFWRALSFMCLGLVLMGIGLVYQKWVFAKPLAAPAAPPTAT